MVGQSVSQSLGHRNNFSLCLYAISRVHDGRNSSITQGWTQTGPSQAVRLTGCSGRHDDSPAGSLPKKAVLPHGSEQHFVLSTHRVQLHDKLCLGERTGKKLGMAECAGVTQPIDLDRTILVPTSLLLRPRFDVLLQKWSSCNRVLSTSRCFKQEVLGRAQCTSRGSDFLAVWLVSVLARH